ncbi:MAG: TIM-barrel domain-containing protein [Caldivirga sp.]|uniref:TIM-barrel domain-containing protein n=1 Tax=Caldivirga sp. TaxID=2080243 RepID=UPI003D0D33A4
MDPCQTIGFSAIENDAALKGSRVILTVKTAISGSTYDLTIRQLPLSVMTLSIELNESSGFVEPKSVRTDVGEFSLIIDTSPLSLTVLRAGKVIFTNKVAVGGGYFRRINNELHVPFSIEPGEGIYGAGEWFGRLNKVGQRLEVYVVDPGGLPNDKTYVAYPFFWSTGGYGLLIDTYCHVTLDFGSRYLGVGELVIPSNVNMYLILSNEPSKIIKAFWELTGHPEIPPLWSFGVWYSLWRDTGYMYSEYRTQDDVVKFAEEVRRRGLPGDVIHIDPIYTFRPIRRSLVRFLGELGLSESELKELEEYHKVNGRWSFRPLVDYIKSKWPDKYIKLASEYPWTGQGCTFEWHDGFPDPASMLKRLHELDFRVSIWVNPYTPVGSRVFNEFNNRGLLVKVKGEPMVEMPAWRGGELFTYRYLVDDFGAVDFTSRDACSAYVEEVRRLLKLGVDTIKTDYGEGAPEEGEYSIGVNPCVHNLYPVLYNKAVYEVIKGEKGEAIVWGRSGGLGIHKYPIRWTGDPDSTPRGMAASLRGVLSMATSGIMYSSVDIGGYSGKPTVELYVRWAQMGLLLSHSRFHGVSEREPWRYGDEAYNIVKGFIKLRYSLIPYIYSQVIEGLRTGKPLVRPLVMDYPSDNAARDIEDEYMLGEYMLIAPVFSGDTRSVYLPEGNWYDYWSMSIIKGPTTINVNSPLSKLPIYVKDGALITYSMVNSINLTSDALHNLLVEVYGNASEFNIDLGKYGRLMGIPITYDKVYSVGEFKVTFTKASPHSL